MNNNLIEYKESFITKIKKFFRGLFKKEKNNNIQEISNDANNVDINKEESQFLKEIRVDLSEIDKETGRNKFLKEIEGNEEKLNTLSIEQLEKLEKYYDNIIAENDKKIKKLKATV